MESVPQDRASASVQGSVKDGPSERASGGQACSSAPPDSALGSAPIDAAAGLQGILKVDEQKVRSHLNEVVRSTVEATINGLLDQEADRVAGAVERPPRRLGAR